MSKAKLLCVFGTGSDVGKSWIAAGLCRLFCNSRVSVAPYKAQNMSNNAGVTPAGLDMGRAQIVQAIAAGVVPHVDMNPLLLKPNSDLGAQVIALGKILGTMSARDYFRGNKEHRWELVTSSLGRLMKHYELIVAEGAGSCAEVNLRSRDLVNMPIAHYGDGQVVLVADIHKGGVFAQIVGTLECMPPEDRQRVKGVIVNRFRGDPTLFQDGVAWLEQRTGVPILGVVPWSFDIKIELEDALSPTMKMDPPPPSNPDHVYAAILRLPHMANFTDFDALARHGVKLHYLTEPRDLSGYDMLLLPGTKNTRGDLGWLREKGWESLISSYTKPIFGLCCGYQMLGEYIDDPAGIEGQPGQTKGLGLLPVRTTMQSNKVTKQVKGLWGEVPLQGYEIHVGSTLVHGSSLINLVEHGVSRQEGAQKDHVFGTYLHGFFDAVGVVPKFLQMVRPDLEWPQLESHFDWRERQLNALAEHLREHLNTELLSQLTGLKL